MYVCMYVCMNVCMYVCMHAILAQAILAQAILAQGLARAGPFKCPCAPPAPVRANLIAGRHPCVCGVIALRQSTADPAWHRRARRQRAEARVLLYGTRPTSRGAFPPLLPLPRPRLRLSLRAPVMRAPRPPRVPSPSTRDVCRMTRAGMTIPLTGMTVPLTGTTFPLMTAIPGCATSP